MQVLKVGIVLLIMIILVGGTIGYFFIKGTESVEPEIQYATLYVETIDFETQGPVVTDFFIIFEHFCD